MLVRLKGVHRVKRKVKGGIREHHYAWRGGPKFWSSDSAIKRGSPEYMAALAACAKAPDSGKFREVIRAYLESGEFGKLSPRYQRDIRRSIKDIDAKFGGAPVAAFNDPRIRGQVLDWRDTFNSAKGGDDRVRHLQKIVSWAYDRSKVTEYRLRGIKALYGGGDRADIMWTEDEIDAFVAGAPAYVGRILVFATETGFAPSDIARASRFHIKGEQIVIRRAKTKTAAAAPITPKLRDMIDTMPAGQTNLIVGGRGRPYKNPDKIGRIVSEWRDKLALRAELRLYDCRGTAATRRLMAGATMAEMAASMGWSMAHAAKVIENYVALHPDMSAGLAVKLAAAKNGG